MKRLFKKRQNVFIKLIKDQAALTLQGMEALKAYMGQTDPQAAANLTKSEKEADAVSRCIASTRS